MASTCWSCHGPVEGAPFCPLCHILQPPTAVDHFALFGLERRFELELERLEAVYHALQQRIHPDRFATRTATERRFSLEHVTRLNEAYRILSDPVARAGYLLTLLGHAPAQGGGGANPAFLLEVMELREALEAVDTQAGDAPQRLERLRREVERRMAADLEQVAGLLAGVVVGEGERLAKVAGYLDQSRFHHRFLEEVERKEERAMESDD